MSSSANAHIGMTSLSLSFSLSPSPRILGLASFLRFAGRVTDSPLGGLMQGRRFGCGLGHRARGRIGAANVGPILRLSRRPSPRRLPPRGLAHFRVRREIAVYFADKVSYLPSYVLFGKMYQHIQRSVVLYLVAM